MAKRLLALASTAALVGLVGVLASSEHLEPTPPPSHAPPTLAGPAPAGSTKGRAELGGVKGLRPAGPRQGAVGWVDPRALAHAPAPGGAEEVAGHAGVAAVDAESRPQAPKTRLEPSAADPATTVPPVSTRASWGVVRFPGSDLVEAAAPAGGGEIPIFVRDDAGEPIEGATVQVRVTRFTVGQPAIEKDLKSAGDGSVAGVPLCDCAYTVILTDVPPAYANRARDAHGVFGNGPCIQFDSMDVGGKAVVLRAERTGSADLLLPRSFLGYGWRPMFGVRDGRGNWQPCPWNPTWKESQGRLRIDRLPLGEVCVTVIVSGLGWGARILTIPPGKLVADSLPFQECSASLTVRTTTVDADPDAQGSAVAPVVLDLETLADGPESAAEWHATFQSKGQGVREAQFKGLLPGRYAVMLRPEETTAASTFGAILDVTSGANVFDLGPLPISPSDGAPLRVEIVDDPVGFWFSVRAMVAPAADERVTWRPVLLDRSKSVRAPPGDVLVTTWLRPPSRGSTSCWSSVRGFLPPSGATIPVRGHP